MTKKKIKEEILKNIKFWTQKETLNGKEIQFKAPIIVNDSKEGELLVLMYPNNNNTFVVFKDKLVISIDIKSYEGTYKNLEKAKEVGIDFVVDYLFKK